MALRRTLLLALAPLAVAAAGDTDDLDELREQVLPTEVEAWQTLPWRTDLAAAAREAADEGKLLFVWSMNGHPLGCT